MARYTIQLCNVINLYGEDVVKGWFMDYELSDYLTDEEIAVIAARGTWSKEKLAQQILDHYYIYEIGFETPGLFAHQAKVAMREIMEEKAPLIYSAAIQYDPLVNVDFTETFDRTSSSEGSSESSSTTGTSGLSVNSDTPQGQISKSAILEGQYASSTGANETESNISDTSSNTGSGSEQYTKRVKGNSGVSATAQKMVQQYRENIIMINRDIIKDINSLFMSIY
ncbi:MAG: hypothetical protein J6R47_04945 [Acholeplasmatales bacterium]|nr:hypothetical protein [Acholeplasmatales bacterium]